MFTSTSLRVRVDYRASSTAMVLQMGDAGGEPLSACPYQKLHRTRNRSDRVRRNSTFRVRDDRLDRQDRSQRDPRQRFRPISTEPRARRSWEVTTCLSVQAARRSYRWCKPPSCGRSMTRPVPGSWTALFGPHGRGSFLVACGRPTDGSPFSTAAIR